MEYIKPTHLARYGILITCGVLCLIGIGAWFISYPETILVMAKLSSSNAPKPIIARQSGRIATLHFGNGDSVTAGTIIGCLETTADIDEVLQLSKGIDSIYNALRDNNATSVKSIMNRPFNHLGELQAAYQSLMQAYLPYRDFVGGAYVTQKKDLLNADMNISRCNISVIKEQEALSQQDLALSHETLSKNKKLLDEKIISEEEYRNLSSEAIGKQMAVPQHRSGYINVQSQQNIIRKEQIELDHQVITQKTLFQQAVFQFKSQLDEWKRTVLLIAPENGILSFIRFLQVNQIVEAGNILAYITPPHSVIYAQAFIPQNNFGKIARGQKVLMKFPAYPWQEYGTLVGTVEYISPVPTDSGSYLAKIVLPTRLITNYKKEIPYRENLTAQSEIITQPMRLTERFYYSIINQIRK